MDRRTSAVGRSFRAVGLFSSFEMIMIHSEIMCFSYWAVIRSPDELKFISSSDRTLKRWWSLKVLPNISVDPPDPTSIVSLRAELFDFPPPLVQLVVLILSFNSGFIPSLVVPPGLNRLLLFLKHYKPFSRTLRTLFFPSFQLNTETASVFHRLHSKPESDRNRFLFNHHSIHNITSPPCAFF